MAAPIRSVLRRPGRARPRHGAAELPRRRPLSRFSPAKAQVASPQPPAARDHAGLAERKPLSQTYFDATGLRWVGAGSEGPNDPNKAKLGKSMSLPLTPQTPQIMATGNANSPRLQLYESSKNDCRPSFNPRSLTNSSRRISHSISSPPPIPIFPPSPAVLPIMRPSGLHPSPGTEFPSLAMSASRSSLSA